MIQRFHIWVNIQKKKKFKKTCASVFTAALFTKAKTWKQRKCPLTEWVKMGTQTQENITQP